MKNGQSNCGEPGMKPLLLRPALAALALVVAVGGTAAATMMVPAAPPETPQAPAAPAAPGQPGVPLPPPVAPPPGVPQAPPAPPTPASSSILPATPPQFVYVRELGYYVAIQVPYELVYIRPNFYLFDRGYWYMTATYGEPWVLVQPRQLPKALVKFSEKEFRRHRDQYRGGERRGRWGGW